MKTLLALIDFSDVTAQVLDQALALAKAFRADVTLLHLVPLEPVSVDFAPSPPSGEQFEARQRRLLAIRDSLAARGVRVTARQYEGLLPETLLEQVKLLNPDLVIMGSHGHGALYNLIVGSVTAAVIKHAACSVLVVPSVPTPATQTEAMISTIDIQNAQPASVEVVSHTFLQP